jgi:putative ABC transport system permease protein
VLLGQKYPKPEQRPAFFDETLERISTVPGVRSAGAVSNLPFNRSNIGAGFTVEGRPEPARGQEPDAEYTVATVGYFETMSIPIRMGRTDPMIALRNA